MKVSENTAGILLLAFTFFLVVLFAILDPEDPENVALVTASWLVVVFFIALIDDEHLLWVIGRSHKTETKKSPSTAEKTQS